MSARNHDLPILDELGAEFAAMASAAASADRARGGAERRGARSGRRADDDPTTGAPGGVDGGAHGPVDRHTVRRRAPLPASSSGGRDRGAQARRIGRRAAIVVVLICLVGGVAFAALRGGGDSGGGAHTAPAQLGRASEGTWTFSAYRDEGRLCTVFVPRGGELSGNCGAAPDHGEVRAGSAIAAGRRYAFGVTGSGVAKVSAALTENGVGPGTRTTAVTKAHAPVDRGAARDAGFPAGDGWFVIDLGPAGAGRAAAPAVITPLDSRGRRTGSPYADCSLGVLGPACKRRIEAAASGN